MTQKNRIDRLFPTFSTESAQLDALPPEIAALQKALAPLMFATLVGD
jgi:hypothetical protein